LDDLREGDDQKWVLNALDGMVREWGGSRFVLTSRPLEILSVHLPPEFEVLNVDVLSDDQISELTEKWVNILLANMEADERREIIDQFMLAFDGDPGFRQLSRSPVMLTSMILVQLTLRRGEELPRAKSEVLRAVVTWLLGARAHRIADRVLNLGEVERVYGYLALSMLQTGNGAGRRSVGLHDASNWLSDRLAENVDRVREFLIAEQDVGLLSRKGRGDICFSVEHFQDFLAASYLSQLPDNGTENWWTTARDFLFVTEWRNTFSLLPACLARGGNRRAALFFHQVAEAVTEQPLAQQAQAYSIAARGCIPLRGVGIDLPSDGQWAVLHRTMERLFTEDALAISMETRVGAAMAHGWVGDERFSDKANLWIRMVGGDSIFGAQAGSTAEPQYDALALPWEAPTRSVKLDCFEIRRFPVTVAEFELFVRSGGYQHRDFWLADGWKWILEGRITTPGNWYRQLEIPNAPATELSFFEASAYCRWLSHQDPRYVVRLPSSEEWEFAARRSALQRQLGNGTWDLGYGEASLVNWLGTELWEKCPVGLFPKSTSDDGVVDLIGNVEEWCRDAWPADLLDPEQERGYGVTTEYGFRIVRGGSAIRAARLCRPTYFSRCRTEGRYPTIGFRPVRQQRFAGT
jgi:formylglycine-generating enzyme required for sulfatase activity